MALNEIYLAFNLRGFAGFSFIKQVGIVIRDIGQWGCLLFLKT